MSIFEELLVLIYHSRREIKENKYEARFNIKTLDKVDSISNILQTLLLLHICYHYKDLKLPPASN